jgi:NADH dehydrogenase (ubiquinone) 1 alpha subcomplex subunit 13
MNIPHEVPPQDSSLGPAPKTRALDSKIVQDGPPAGGYGPVQYKRNLPKRLPSNVAIAAGVVGIMTFGFYKVVTGNRERRSLKLESQVNRIKMLPFLQAEEDIR